MISEASLTWCIDMDHFLLSPEQYSRDLNIVGTAINDAALFLQKMRGLDREAAIEFVRRTIGKDGKFPIKNPQVTIIDKDKNGDRYVRKTGYLNYLKNIVAKDLLCAPSMTTYLRPEVLQSEIGLYINGNLDLRNRAKHEGLVAKMAASSLDSEITALQAEPSTPVNDLRISELMAEKARQESIESIKHNEQTSHKIFNNGISGMQTIGSTPFVLVSAHSALTSGCRSAVSYGNATIERFVAGSRHYWSPEVVLTQILTISSHTDKDALKRVMEKYNLHCPTVDEVMQVVKYSTDLYWFHQDSMEDICDLVQRLEPIERASFVYTGDMYWLRKFNDELVKGLIEELSTVVRGVHPDPVTGAKAAKGDHKALTLILCSEVTAGKSIEKLIEAGNMEALSMVALTYENIMHTLDKYADLISSLWTTLNLPANISRTRDLRRRSVVGSDTDSCLFSVREWVKWKNGRATFDAECQATWHTVVFMACQTVTHSLACLSAGMGVKGDDVKKLAMKNEFAFSVFGLTNIAKHYWASMIAQEGGVYAKPKLEIKGVQFKDSNSPPEIIDESDEYIINIIDQIYRNGSFEIMPILKSMSKTESTVTESITKGDTKYLKSAYVRPKEDYKKPMSSNYFHYELWNKAFSHYGPAPELPYRAVKISIDLPNKTAIREWISSIENPVCRAALEEIYIHGEGGGGDPDVDDEIDLDDNPDPEAQMAKVDASLDNVPKKPKASITSFLMPLDIVQTKGIPKEILQAANLRRQTYAAVSPFYLTAESLGLPMINKNLTNMLSDSL